MIFQPVLLTIPLIQAQPGITQAEAHAANAWLLNEAQQLAFAQAILVSVNRANCAAVAGDSADETKQMQAAGNYSTELAGFVSAAAGTRANLVSAIQGAGFTPVTSTPSDVFLYELNILFFGLPADTLQAVIELGADSDTINFVTGLLLVQDINLTAGTFPDFLNNSATSSLEQSLAIDLVNFGIGGVPLKSGQMVQAQGWIPSGQGKTTFALEAHVDQNGSLLGKLELNDHSGFSIQHGRVAHALLTGSNTFSVDGTYIASDGSSQTWNARADATQQSIAISTSEGFAFSGVLGGGNVGIKQ
jgi:hypothetical protein